MALDDLGWFKHVRSAAQDPKLLTLKEKHGFAGLGVFWCIVEYLSQQPGFCIAAEEREVLPLAIHGSREEVAPIVDELLRIGLLEIYELSPDDANAMQCNAGATHVQCTSNAMHMQSNALHMQKNPCIQHDTMTYAKVLHAPGLTRRMIAAEAERERCSEARRRAAMKRWTRDNPATSLSNGRRDRSTTNAGAMQSNARAMQSNAGAMHVQCNAMHIREEKRREEKRRSLSKEDARARDVTGQTKPKTKAEQSDKASSRSEPERLSHVINRALESPNEHASAYAPVTLSSPERKRFESVCSPDEVHYWLREASVWAKNNPDKWKTTKDKVGRLLNWRRRAMKEGKRWDVEIKAYVCESR